MIKKINGYYRKYKNWKKKNIKLVIIVKSSLTLSVLLFFIFFKWLNYYPRNINLKADNGYFGITFSTKYCDELDLDYKEVYAATLNDLGAKNIRIPIYWDEIEKEEGIYDFEKYDYLINEGEKYDAKFVISIGRRVPRWPECHSPNWLLQKDQESSEEQTLKMLTTVVNRYKNRKSVEYWQVENEAFLDSFGVCPPLDEDFLNKEFELVRSLDNRKIIITSSGELRFWNREAKIGDIFGSTLYRVVYNSWFGFVKYPFPTSFYSTKAKMAHLKEDELMVMELQTEPWVSQGKITQLSKEQIDKSLSVEQFEANLQYAVNLNFSRVYVWGNEWWYFEKKYGNKEYWEIGKKLFN